VCQKTHPRSTCMASDRHKSTSINTVDSSLVWPHGAVSLSACLSVCLYVCVAVCHSDSGTRRERGIYRKTSSTPGPEQTS